MLVCAVVFLTIAIIATVIWLGGIAAGAAGVAKILFVFFLALFIASLIDGLVRRDGSS